MRHAPPSNRVVYTKLKGGIIQVRYHWCSPEEPMNAMLVAWMGAESVRGRGEYFQYEAGSDGEPNFHGSTGAMPPSDEPVEYWEWEEFRRLERLAGCASASALLRHAGGGGARCLARAVRGWGCRTRRRQR